MTLDIERVKAALPAYDVGSELGRGGWGVVLEARHRSLVAAREAVEVASPRRLNQNSRDQNSRGARQRQQSQRQLQGQRQNAAP